MTEITGTTGVDTLIGTNGDDILTPLGSTGGGREVLIGRLGADVYDLQRSAGAGVYDFVIRDDNSDGAVDAITNVGALTHSASLGYIGYASAIRVGDNLVIHTPGKPYRFRDPAIPGYDIVIKDQYGNGTVESFQAGGVTYALVTGDIGTAGADFMAGSHAADAFSSGEGDDWMFGNGGNDALDAGNGANVVFAGTGRDTVTAGAGNDLIFGEGGGDRIRSGAGFDRIEGGAGRDVIWAGADNDMIDGGDGNDVIRGEAGQDYLAGGAGDDFLIGGREGDTYAFASRLGDAGWGHDIIREAGNRPSYLNIDTIELAGFYSPSDGNSAEAYARLEFFREGDDMWLVADGGVSSILVQDMFGPNQNRYDIETLEFNAAYWTPITFQIVSAENDDIGDDRNHGTSLTSEAHELIFGNDDGQDIFGGAGTNFIWTGAGADVLIYKENDPQVWYGYGGGMSHDIVQDFDITQDRLDFSEVSVGGLSGLTISEDADGDALIGWSSGSVEIASIAIELRGVSMADVTADLFIFA